MSADSDKIKNKRPIDQLNQMSHSLLIGPI